MTLQTVTLTWDLTDLIQAGAAATLTIWPTSQLVAAADSVIITQLPRSVTFASGTGQLAGIVAIDNEGLEPAGQGYNIVVTGQSTVLTPAPVLLQMTVAINHADGATQDLSGLTEIEPDGTFSAYLPLSYPDGASDSYVWTTDADGNGSWQPAPGGTGSAPLASPAFTGNPTAPTQAAGNNSTRLANTAFVAAALAAIAAGTVIQPSADDTGITEADQINSVAAGMAATGGWIILGPGTHYWDADAIIVDTPGVYIWGPGTACVVNVVGTGDGIRMYSTVEYAPGGLFGGGLLGGFLIDGSAAGSGSSAFHIGDIFGLDFDVRIRRFQGTGDRGAWFDNNYFWTEGIRGRIFAEECTKHVVFDNSANTSGSATGSFDRAQLDIYVDCKNKGGAVEFDNGAFMLGQDLTICGNTDQPSAQTAVLTLTGSNTGGYSRIGPGKLSIDVELNNISSGTQPQTINFGSAGDNTITGCTGVINFAGDNPFATAVNFGGSFEFDGPVYGDHDLQRTAGVGMLPYEYGALASSDLIYTRYAGIVRVTTTSNVTGITLSIGATATQVPQTLTIINSGTGSITFAQSSSNVAGGAANAIAPNSAALFIWNGDADMWYPVGLPAAASTLALAPAGATGETFPRQYGNAYSNQTNGYSSGLTSGTVIVSAIPLAAGLPINDLNMVVGSTAFTLADVTHGWYALLDSGRVVRAVTADQTSGNWGTPFAEVGLSVSASAYVTTYTGLYYFAFCAVFTGTSAFFPVLNVADAGITSLAPVLAGTSSTGQTTPPALGTTLGAITSVTGGRFYAYTS